MSLTQKQILAAKALSNGCSQQEAADQVRVDRKTIQRWLKREDFKTLSYSLTESATKAPPVAKEVSCSEKIENVNDLIPDSLGVLKEILLDPEARRADRLRAVDIVLRSSGLPGKNQVDPITNLNALVVSGWLPQEKIEKLASLFDEFNNGAKLVMSDS